MTPCTCREHPSHDEHGVLLSIRNIEVLLHGLEEAFKQLKIMESHFGREAIDSHFGVP